MHAAPDTGRSLLSQPNTQRLPLGSSEAKRVITAFFAAAQNSRSTFCDDPIDVAWLRETHLAHVTDLTEFQSFEFMGNEDAPTHVWIYRERSPSLFDSPLRKFTHDKAGFLR